MVSPYVCISITWVEVTLREFLTSSVRCPAVLQIQVQNHGVRFERRLGELEEAVAKRKNTLLGTETLPPGSQSVALLAEQTVVNIWTATLTRPFQDKHGPRLTRLIKHLIYIYIKNK
jgi:hypothetical protein